MSDSDLLTLCSDIVLEDPWSDLPLAGCSIDYGSIMSSDPFILALRNYCTKATTFSAHSTAGSHWRTRAYTENNSMWYNLQLFNEVVFGLKRKKPKGNWKPRFRATQSGVVLSGANESLRTLGTAFQGISSTGYIDLIGVPSFLDVPFVQMYGESNSRPVASWRHLHDFAKELQYYLVSNGLASVRMRRRNPPTSGSLYFDFVLSNLVIGDDTITYDGEWFRRDLTHGVKHTIYGSAVLTRPYAGLPFVDLDFGLTSQVLQGTCGSKSSGSYAIDDLVFHNVPDITVGDQSLVSGFSDEHAHSIIGAHPALYLTQCEALKRLVGDIHANFETLVENAELIEGLSALSVTLLELELIDIKRITQSLGIVVSDFRYFDRIGVILRVIRFLASGYLAWIFAINPTIESIVDAFERASRLPLPKYEATRTFTHESTPFVDLNEDLKSYVISNLPVSPEDVSSYKITFHTEISAELSIDYILGVLGDGILSIFNSTGSIPELAYAYKAQPFTWVLDSFIPLGKMLEYAETYFRSDKTAIRSIGHSVFIHLTLTDGHTFDTYIRSDNTTVSIFPPVNCWLDPVNSDATLVPVSIIAGLGITT